MEPPKIVFVDVDDTLVRSVGGKRILMPAAIRYVRRLHAAGAELYCWSSGGAEYARVSAEECGLAECFRAFLPKPHLIIDDQPLIEWRRLEWLHPLNCPAEPVD